MPVWRPYLREVLGERAGQALLRVDRLAQAQDLVAHVPVGLVGDRGQVVVISARIPARRRVLGCRGTIARSRMWSTPSTCAMLSWSFAVV